MRTYSSEDQIEREAERMMNRLDAVYMKEDSDMSLDEYNHQVAEIELWTKLRYRELRQMFRFLLGMVLGASATTGLGLSFVMGTIGFGFMVWGFCSMWMNGELLEG